MDRGEERVGERRVKHAVKRTVYHTMRAYVPMREDTRPYVTESVWSSSAERVDGLVRERGVHSPGRPTVEDAPMHIPAGTRYEMPVLRLPAVDWRETCPLGVCTTAPELVDRGEGEDVCRVPAGLHTDEREWSEVREPATQAVERCSTPRGEWTAIRHTNLHPRRRHREEAVEIQQLERMPACLAADSGPRVGVRALTNPARGKEAYSASTSFCITYSFTSSEEGGRVPILSVSAVLASRRAVAERAEVDVRLVSVSKTGEGGGGRGVRYVLRAEARSLSTHSDTRDDMRWIVRHDVLLDRRGGEWLLEYTALSGLLLDVSG